ncbi:MAG: hypothetical protein KGJ14_11910 [Nitrospirota bacterium]|nr:hypothetical protein [Nitrospirota bacterium]
MSWGYWGIVAGLAGLLAVFFICMELLYAHVRQAAKAGRLSVETGSGQPSGAAAKQAA